MGTKNNIESLIEPLKTIEFKIYSLESSKQFIFKEKFYLKELAPNLIPSILPTSLYWSFNDKSTGDYCRELDQNIQKIKHSLPEVINSLTDISQEEKVVEVVLKALSGIAKENDGVDSFKNRGKFSLEYPTKPLLETSLNRIYEFRKSRINDLIKSIEDEYIYRIEKKPAAKVVKIVGPTKGHQQRVRMEGFCWNKNRNLIEDLVVLHTYLREYDFIDKDTSIKTLQQALGC